MPTLARAETWPSRAVTLVVAQGPGSGSDISARLLAGPMGTALGQPVVEENRTGGGGAIAHQSVARAQPDGHTLIFSSTAALLVLPLINPGVRYAMEDFTAVAPVLRAPFAILVSTAPGAPATLAELVARLRRDRTAYASAGVGTMTHLAAEAFLRRAGVEAVHVPYRGSGAALTDLIGGQVVFAADSLTASMPHVAGRRLRALAVTGERREAVLPDVPTLAEAGLPGAPIAVLGGLFAPRDTPAERVARLAAATDRALADPEVAARFQASQTEILREGREAFVARLREEEPAWRALVRQLDLRLE